MSHLSSTILAVAPGTRELGVAVLQNSELLFYGIKTVSRRKNPLTVLEIVSSHLRNLVKKYRPDYLAVEKIIIRQHSYALLAVVAEQIKATAKEMNLPVGEYAPVSVRKRLCETGRATKCETAEILATRFPELKRYYLRTTKWECDYYGNLFAAVALGVICEEDLLKSESSDSAKLSTHNLHQIL